MPKDWDDFARGHPDAPAPPPCSSDEFAAHIRRDFPHLAVPEGSIVPVDGYPGHSTAHESRPAPGQPCPVCGDRIAPGSVRYCWACQASGFEASLQAQRNLAGFPPQEPRTAPAIPLPAPRKSNLPPTARQIRRAEKRERRKARTPFVVG